MLRDNALADKVIVVTGGGSGLGKAMTKYFLELGAKVAITSHDIEKLKIATKSDNTIVTNIDLFISNLIKKKIIGKYNFLNE